MLKNSKMNFKDQDLDKLSIDEIVKLRKLRKLRIQTRKRENKAARIIQKAIKRFLERKRFNEYTRKFKQAQK